MNENRYAEGGEIKLNPGAIGGFFLQPEKGIDRKSGVNFYGDITNPKVLQQLGSQSKKFNAEAFYNATKDEQSKLVFGSAAFKQGKKLPSKITDKLFNKDGTINKTKKLGLGQDVREALNDPKTEKRIANATKKGALKVNAVPTKISGSLSSYFPGRDDLETSIIANTVSTTTKDALRSAVSNSVKPISKILDNPVININDSRALEGANRIANDANALKTTEGFIFEGIIDAITGATLAGGQANFDFPSSSISSARNSLKGMFVNSSGEKGIDSLIKADAKRSNTPKAISSIQNKILNDINKGILEGISIQKFATGGSVGTDTVPALLTPGEFVVNRKAAQNIGYGNLNRVNKVGKYAKGGIVQHFANGSGPSGVQRRAPSQLPSNIRLPPGLQQLTQASATTAQNITQLGQSANNASQSNNNARQATSNAGLALSLIPATIQSFLPPIDESSGALAKLTSSALNMVTMLGSVVFALDAFNISLNTKNLTNIFGSGSGGLGNTINKNIGALFNKATGSLGNFGRALRGTTQATARGGSGSAVMQTLAGRGVTGTAANIGGGIGRIAGPLSKVLGSVVSKIAGPLAALSIVSGIVGTFRDLDGQLKDAIKAQDTAKAQSLAVSKANADAIPLIGSLVGGFADLIGQSDGLAGILKFLGGNTANSIKSSIAAQIATAKANESLAKASEASTEAMQDLQNGAITASQGLQKVAVLTASAESARQANLQAIEAKSADRAAEGTFTGRNIFTLGGLLGETGGQRNKRIGEEQAKLADENIRLQKEALAAQQPLIQATARSVFAQGGSMADAQTAIQAAGGINLDTLQQQIEDLGRRAEAAQLSGDTQTANELLRQQNALGKQSESLTRQLKNIEIEVGRANATFKALNLGLQGVTAAATGGVVSLKNYLAAQESGNSTVVRAAAVLEAGITSAAQGISDTDFDNALGELEKTILSLGGDQTQVNQIKSNLQALNVVQKQFPSTLESLRKTLQSETAAGLTRGSSPERQKELIGTIIQKQLKAANISQETRDAFRAEFDSLKLDDPAIKGLLENDLSALGPIFEKLGKGTFDKLKPIIDAQSESNQKLNTLLRSRLELENKLVSAQRQRLDIELEAADIAAKYGGAAVTPEIRRQNVIAQANVQSRRDLRAAGDLRQVTAAEFNARNARISSRL
jgi:hypothetical protein